MAKKPAAAAALNIFNIAPEPKPAPKTAKGKARPSLTVEGLDQYAQFKTVAVAIQSLCVEQRETIDPALYDYFATEGARLARQPENPDGVGLESIGLGSMQCRKRGTNSPLSPEEVEFLTEHEIPVETVILKPATFIVNPKYLARPDVMAAVGEAMGAALASLGIDVTDPDNLFVQKQNEESKVVVSEETILATFKKSEDVIREVLPVVATLGVRAKVAPGVTLETALETTIKGLVAHPELIAEALSDPAKVNTKNEAAAKRKPRVAKKAA